VRCFTGSDAQVFLDFRSAPIPNWAVNIVLMRMICSKETLNVSLCNILQRLPIPLISIVLILIMIKHQAVLTLVVTFNKTIMSNVNLVEQFSPLIEWILNKKFIKKFTEIKRQSIVNEF
jgi:hypothetical protein